MVHHASPIGLITQSAAAFLSFTVALTAYAQDNSQPALSLLQTHVGVLEAKRPHFFERGAESKANHSSHTCYGSGVGSTCLMRNVCIDTYAPAENTNVSRSKPHGRQLLYFSDDPLAVGEYRLNIAAPFHCDEIHHPKRLYQRFVTVRVVQGALPRGAAMSSDETSAIFEMYNSEQTDLNFGHLVDATFAIFRMQQVFGIPFDARILLWYTNRTMKRAANMTSDVFSGIARDGQQVGFQALSSRHVVSSLLRKSSNHRPFSRYLCFPQALVGTGSFSFASPSERSSSLWWEYRRHVLSNFDNIESYPVMDIAISYKGGKSAWRNNENPGELDLRRGSYERRIHHLHKRLTKSLVKRSVAIVDFKDLSMGQQAKMASKLDVLITHPGGGSFVGLFLPPGASLIITVDPALLDDEEDRRGIYNNEYALWSSLHWLTFQKITNLKSVEQHVHRSLR